MSTDETPPRIGARTVLAENPWARIFEAELIGPQGPARAPYLVVDIKHYIAICAQRADGRIVLVRQFRPALEQAMWELPTGVLEPGETPEAGAGRELFEETGHRLERPVALGCYDADPGRSTNHGHMFFGAATPAEGWQPEPGVVAAWFTVAEIDAMIDAGQFTALQQIALWLIVKAAGLLDGEADGALRRPSGAARPFPTTLDPSRMVPAMPQDDDPTRIGARDLVAETPWVRVVDKEVLAPSVAPQRYIVVEVKDYVAICAQCPDARFLMVRQFRPPLEQTVWEFPSGQLEPGETPATAVARELFEETGHRADHPVSLGCYHADPGRLTNRGHLFFGTVVPGTGWQPEPGVAVERVSAAEIDAMIADGRFHHLQHIALWLMVKAAGLAKG